MIKFSCDSSNLKKCVSTVEKAVSAKSNLAVMENIFFQLEGNVLTLRGNDLEIGIQDQVSVDKVEGQGGLLIKARTISNIISKIDSPNLEVKVDQNHKLFIKADLVDFDILGMSTDEYPVFPKIENGYEFNLAVSDLKNLIKFTIFSVSFDETKRFLNGVLIKSEGNVLTFVSTDGYRLSIRNLSFQTELNPFLVIVPYKGLNELYKIIQHEKDDSLVSVTVSEQQIAFTVNGVRLISRLIQGQFPDYKQVVPAQNTHSVRVSRRAFLDAAERASIIASNSNNVVRFHFGDEFLTLQASSPGMGEFREDVGLSRTLGTAGQRVAFNVRLLLDAIKNFESDEISISFNGELSPCLIRSDSDPDYVYVIMPIRTADFSAEPERAVSAAG